MLLVCSIAARAEIVSLEATPAVAGKYEKVEFTIRHARAYRNPFDSQEAEISVEVQTPEGITELVPCFFTQNYEHRDASKESTPRAWDYPVGQPVWKARYAPRSIGKFSCRARVRDARGELASDTVPIECRPTNDHGFIRVSPRDHRQLEFSEGQPFFPIGQNLAFVGQDQYLRLQKLDEVFGKMADNGANFARIWTCCSDWALCIEGRKSAWSRSWSWKPPCELVPGYFEDDICVVLKGKAGDSLKLEPCHPVPLRPGTRYALSGLLQLDEGTELAIQLGNSQWGEMLRPEAERGESPWKSFRREFTSGADQYWLERLQFQLETSGSARWRDLSLTEADGGPELLWEASVNRDVVGYYNPLDCEQIDQVLAMAERRGIYLQLCLLTRDLYMDKLRDESSADYDWAISHARNLLRYAVARWGYSTHVAAWEYFNEMDPGRPTDRFYDSLGSYLEQIDVNHHLRTTSAWGPAPKDWRHPRIDIAELHWYLRPAWGDLSNDEVAAVADRTKALREHAPDKPALLAEFGLAGNQWELSPLMKQDQQLVHFRRSLWTSAMTGLSGTAMFWWWEDLDRQAAYRHYGPLAAFLKDAPVLRETLDVAANPQDVRAIGVGSKNAAYVWIADAQWNWSSRVKQHRDPRDVQGATLTLSGFDSGPYLVEWWDTQRGVVLHEQSLTAPADVWQLDIPAFREDIACRIRRAK
jgi:hypothetical protein